MQVADLCMRSIYSATVFTFLWPTAKEDHLAFMPDLMAQLAAKCMSPLYQFLGHGALQTFLHWQWAVYTVGNDGDMAQAGPCTGVAI